MGEFDDAPDIPARPLSKDDQTSDALHRDIADGAHDTPDQDKPDAKVLYVEYLDHLKETKLPAPALTELSEQASLVIPPQISRIANRYDDFANRGRGSTTPDQPQPGASETVAGASVGNDGLGTSTEAHITPPETQTGAKTSSDGIGKSTEAGVKVPETQVGAPAGSGEIGTSIEAKLKTPSVLEQTVASNSGSKANAEEKGPQPEGNPTLMQNRAVQPGQTIADLVTARKEPVLSADATSAAEAKADIKPLPQVASGEIGATTQQALRIPGEAPPAVSGGSGPVFQAKVAADNKGVSLTGSGGGQASQEIENVINRPTSQALASTQQEQVAPEKKPLPQVASGEIGATTQQALRIPGEAPPAVSGGSGPVFQAKVAADNKGVSLTGSGGGQASQEIENVINRPTSQALASTQQEQVAPEKKPLPQVASGEIGATTQQVLRIPGEAPSVVSGGSGPVFQAKVAADNKGVSLTGSGGGQASQEIENVINRPTSQALASTQQEQVAPEKKPLPQVASGEIGATTQQALRIPGEAPPAVSGGSGPVFQAKVAEDNKGVSLTGSGGGQASQEIANVIVARQETPTQNGAVPATETRTAALEPKPQVSNGGLGATTEAKLKIPNVLTPAQAGAERITPTLEAKGATSEREVNGQRVSEGQWSAAIAKVVAPDGRVTSSGGSGGIGMSTEAKMVISDTKNPLQTGNERLASATDARTEIAKAIVPRTEASPKIGSDVSETLKEAKRGIEEAKVQPHERTSGSQMLVEAGSLGSARTGAERTADRIPTTGAMDNRLELAEKQSTKELLAKLGNASQDGVSSSERNGASVVTRSETAKSISANVEANTNVNASKPDTKSGDRERFIHQRDLRSDTIQQTAAAVVYRSGGHSGASIEGSLTNSGSQRELKGHSLAKAALGSDPAGMVVSAMPGANVRAERISTGDKSTQPTMPGEIIIQSTKSHGQRASMMVDANSTDATPVTTKHHRGKGLNQGDDPTIVVATNQARGNLSSNIETAAIVDGKKPVHSDATLAQSGNPTVNQEGSVIPTKGHHNRGPAVDANATAKNSEAIQPGKAFLDQIVKQGKEANSPVIEAKGDVAIAGQNAARAVKGEVDSATADGRKNMPGAQLSQNTKEIGLDPQITGTKKSGKDEVRTEYIHPGIIAQSRKPGNPVSEIEPPVLRAGMKQDGQNSLTQTSQTSTPDPTATAAPGASSSNILGSNQTGSGGVTNQGQVQLPDFRLPNLEIYDSATVTNTQASATNQTMPPLAPQTISPDPGLPPTSQITDGTLLALGQPIDIKPPWDRPTETNPVWVNTPNDPSLSAAEIKVLDALEANNSSKNEQLDDRKETFDPLVASPEISEEPRREVSVPDLGIDPSINRKEDPNIILENTSDVATKTDTKLISPEQQSFLEGTFGGLLLILNDKRIDPILDRHITHELFGDFLNEQKRPQYITKEGDSLERIARYRLKDPRLAPLIYTLNRKILGAKFKTIGAKLPIGIELQLPSVAEILRFKVHVLGEPLPDYFYRDTHNRERTDEASSVETSSSYSCRLGDSLTSLARKHPAMLDESLWLLLAEVNGLSTTTDRTGRPLATLKRGDSIRIPTNKEIEDFKRKRDESSHETDTKTRPAKPNAVHSEPRALVSTINPSPALSEAIINHETKELRVITQPNLGEAGDNLALRLEMKFKGQWRPIVEYKVGEQFSGLTMYESSGSTKCMPIDLSTRAMRELAEHDIAINAQKYCEYYLAQTHTHSSAQ